MDGSTQAVESGTSGATAPLVRAALLCNPRSGALSRLPDAAPALQQAIALAGFAVIDAIDHEAGLEEQWAEAMRAGAEVVFVAGGDGTLRCAAAWALRDDITLAFLPGGTMNRVCARLGLNQDVLASVDRYRPGALRRLGVGRVNGEVFLFESLLGTPARLLRFREMQRGSGLLGWFPLLRMAWRKLRAIRQGSIRVSLPDGTRRRGSAAIITLPEPGSPPLLQLGVTRPTTSWGRLKQAWAWFRGRLERNPDAQVTHVPRLVVTSRRPLMRLSLDGEMHLLPPPLRYRMMPDALRILAPRA